ncbi:hypothetical protein D0Q02_10270 [Micromonospora craniellae]|uniref:WYL domain-containing protein n=1 Tax=Micromonospora craniellae TaxID=2294034 RepID=A0A372G216_9ACTN|nr:hypothetical protein D0Q02_10270 [Micromonospora craniellae]
MATGRPPRSVHPLSSKGPDLLYVASRGKAPVHTDGGHRRERVQFDYTSHHGARSRRTVEPHALVSWGR